MSKKSEREARIKAVEADPRYGRDRDPGRADKETATDPVDDPRFQKGRPDDPLDHRQTHIRPGVISHPEWDDS